MSDNEPDKLVPRRRRQHSGVSFHIERLVIDNLPLESRHAGQLQTAVERELSRLIARNGLNQALITTGATPFLGTRGIEVSSGTNPRRLGNQIARAIYSGLKA